MRLIKRFIKMILQWCSICKVNIRNAYVRTVYRGVTNELRLNNIEPYDYKGVYITLKNTPPYNYKKVQKSFLRDEDGIRRYVYPNKNGEETLQYNCVLIAQQGLSEYGYYLNTKKKEHLEQVFLTADWLINRQEDNGAWIEHFDFYLPNVSEWQEAPWVSAMGQGQAISLMCRCYLLTGDDKYLNSAKLAVNPFEISSKSLGVVSYYGDKPIYEEFPSKTPSFVLNGFAYSLFGLYDLFCITKDKRVKRLFDEGIDTLKTILPLYDDSGLSYYDLGYITAPFRVPTTNPKYHLIHIRLLYGLHSITGEEIFEFYAKKWERQ
ncbi:MAG: hypothetical protein KBS68_05490 [Clostridiales bacterium]|nr:hypothetical protein [Candidatus Crickella merdequi]